MAAAILITAMGAGPIFRRVRPRRVWLPETLGCVCLLLSLGQQWLQFGGLQTGAFDVFHVAGYGFVVLWMGMLTLYAGRGDDIATALDTITVTVGALLVVWAIGVVPLSGGMTRPVGLAVAIYPAVDMTMVALTVHMSLRLGRKIVALRWLLITLTLQLLIDVWLVTLAFVSPDRVPSALAPYLFTCLGFALSATHPSVTEMTRRPPRTAVRRPGRPAALMVFTASPIVLSVITPLDGLLDVSVRTTFVALLFTLLIVRLSRTMRALSQAEEESRHRATHDALTGLLNRAALLDALESRLRIDAADGRRTVVFFLDCDGFKHVNDTWGHHAGDTLLRGIADRVQAGLRPDDVLARHGGDEFIILTSIDAEEEAGELAIRIQRLFEQPLHLLPQRTHTMTPSIGIAISDPNETVSAEELVARADAAMYCAKQAGRGRSVFFDDALATRAQFKATIGDRLQQALTDRAFDVELQPIVHTTVHGFTVVGWEALPRWVEPQLGDVPAEVFLAVAEEQGLMRDLGEQLLERVCTELAAFRATVPADDIRTIALDVSSAQLFDPGFPETVRRAIAAAGLPEGLLWLDVTESALIGDEARTLETLDALQQAGVRVALDHFGTGFAPLGVLTRVRAACVKIDRSLVDRAGTDPAATRQLSAVVDLLHSLGIDAIVASGVDSDAQAALVARIGCSLMKGSMFGSAVTPSSIRGHGGDVVAMLSEGAS